MTWLSPLVWTRALLKGTEWAVNWFSAAPMILLPLLAFLIIATGRFGLDLGLDDLFWHDERALAFLNGLSLGFLAWQVFLIHFLLLRRRERFRQFLRDESGATRRQAVQIYFMVLVLGYGLLILLSRAPVRVPNWVQRYWLVLDHRSDTWLALGLGLMLSFLVGLLMLSRAHQLRLGTKILNRVKALEARLLDERFRLGDPIPGGDEFLHNLASCWFFFALGSVLLVVALHWWPVHGLPPVTVLGVVLSLAIAIYGFLAFHLRGLQYLLVGVVVLWVGCIAPQPYQLSLPHLEEEYAAARAALASGFDDDALKNVVRVDTVLQANKAGVHRHNHYLALPQPPGQIDSVKLLRTLESTGGKRPLILVCASGGGIRAAVWTALMLERLERELPSFHRDVRLLTGASGGMLALATYAGGFDQFNLKLDPAAEGGGKPYPLGPLSAVMAKDSLSYPVQTMVLHDLPRWFWPGPWKRDRGLAIEEQWRRNWRAVHPRLPCPLSRDLGQLREAEMAGDQPLLVLSPMIVEDGRRLLITNLDLARLTTAEAPLADALDRHATLARGSLEYSRLFPRRPMPLATAARLSASFPLVSPTLELPTYPALRVVDAGYYDNFGVLLASSWLFHHRDWVRRHASGVLLVQLRAYADDFERYNIRSEKTAAGAKPEEAIGRHGVAHAETMHDPDLLSGEERDYLLLAPPPRRGIKDAVTALVTPLEGVLNSMSAQQRYGNDAALDALNQLWSAAPNEPPFLRTLILEYRGEASLSWQLSQAELLDLRLKANHPSIRQRLRAAGAWLAEK